MENMNWLYLGIPVALFIIVAIFCATRYVLVKETSSVLVIKRLGGKIVVEKTGGFVWPFINSYTIVSLTPRVITVYSGNSQNMITGTEATQNEYNTHLRIGDGSYCRNDIKVDIAVTFKLSIPFDSLAEIAGQFDPNILNNIKELANFFEPTFAEALKSATRQHDYLDLINDRTGYRESVRKAIAKELHSFNLADVLISEIRQTPVDKLNPNDILDAQGLELITKTTTEKNVNIKKIKEEGDTQFTEQEVKGKQARLQLNLSWKEEEFKTNSAIEVTRLEEETRVKNKEAEENLERAKIRIRTEQESRIAEQNSEREIQTSEINNKQMLGIKEQESLKEVRLAEVEANNEVAKKDIENSVIIASKNVELHTKEAEVVGIKKEIEKEEQNTLDIKAFSTAERNKKVKLTEAEAEATAVQIKEVTYADTEKQKTVIRAETQEIDANAKLIVLEKEVVGRKKLAEVSQDEIAAQGIGEAKAMNAKTEAAEKSGAVEAKNIEIIGNAKAEAQKANYAAMEVPEPTRNHEIALKKMDNELAVETKKIEADREIGVADAQARGKAMENAKIDIIGDAGTLEALTRSRTTGLSLDRKIRGSDLLSKVAEPYLSGEKDLPADMANILKEITADGSDIMNLTIAQAMTNPKFGGLINKMLFGSKE